MKKFGRGFSLDFAALMNEVRQPAAEGDEAAAGHPTTSLDPTEGGSSSTDYARFNSHGSEVTTSPVDLSTTPTEDSSGSPADPGRTGSGLQYRVSVSRTGRCKNRNRQRLTVLQDEDIYRVGPSSSSDEATGKAVKAPPPRPPPRPSSAANPKTSAGDGERSEGRDSIAAAPAAAPTAAPAAAPAATGEVFDFDSVLNALDKSIQAPTVMADCYSF